ncbi:MAG: ABC transporter ATP-binding protein [Candidatus Hydrogenedentota bacterium]|nr:MAG: ABC transporter ATP-binding protein [Candidatus Hydrogenedentota bacterium]
MSTMRIPNVLALKAENIIKKFGNFTAVNNVSLSVKKGEAIALLGPNGAGKTTFVEMVEGIQKPTAGHIEILGLTWEKQAKEIQHRIGLVLQENRFLDRVTVFETLKLFTSFYNVPSAKAEYALKKVNLVSKRDDYTMNLSGGQRQRLAIALALLNDPELLLLDEPTTGLDPHARREVWNIIKELKKSGTAIVLTTHYMEEAEKLCDKIYIMFQGKILLSGTMKELLASQEYQSIVDLHFKGQLKKSFQHPAVIRQKKFPGGIRFYAKELKEILPPLMEWIKKNQIKIEDLNCRNLNLDDLFTELTGHKLNEQNRKEA